MDAPTAPPSITPEPAPAASLLPAALLRPAAALWLWVLPVGVMLLLNLQGYWLVEGNMDAAQRGQALVLGLAGAANLVAGLAFYFFSRRLAPRLMSPLSWYGAFALPALLVQVAYLWTAVTVGDHVLPESVTLWIYPADRFFFNQFAFAMVPLFLGILRLAGGRPPRHAGQAISINLGFAVGAPVLFYLLALGIPRLLDGLPISALIFSTALVGLGLLMFMGLVRALLVALRAAAKWGAAGERVAIVLCALVLPVGGLLLNRNIPFPVTFQAWEVYALVVATTTMLLLASWQHARCPRISFGLLCATFPFSLYFFVVFLPYTPLSILAVVVMGAGFLVLTPTFLFTLHLSLLHKARVAALAASRPLHLAAIGLACGLLLPAFFVGRGLADKTALHAALDYVYAPAITGGDLTYPGNRTNLRRALASHRHYKNGIYYPLLSDFYAWLVFDNLVLPDDKLAHLERTFFGPVRSTKKEDRFAIANDIFGGRNVRDRHRMPQATPPPRTVDVRRLELRTHESGTQNTTVTLALTLENTGTGGAEYLKTLPLPAGIFVNGFRLHINGTPVPGRIFEKKTALWVYTMIRDSERRDPGLLVYNRPDELELRVFPINPDTPAIVEIDFLLPGTHASARIAHDTRDPAAALVHFATLLAPHLARDERGTFVAGGLATSALPAVEREVRLHLIVDRSEENGFVGDLEALGPRLRQQFPAAESIAITLANFQVADLKSLESRYDEALRVDERALHETLPIAGGFALGLALAHAIDAYRHQVLESPRKTTTAPPRPVFVIISETARPRALDPRLAEAWADLLPGLEVCELGADETFVTQCDRDVRPTPLLRLGSCVRPLLPNRAVRFRPAADDVSLEFWSPQETAWLPVPNVTRADATSPWSRAVALQLQNQDYARSPGDAGVNLPALVKASRESGILLPATSYIVVENEAQWRMLDRAEARKLGQNAALEFLETPTPPALLVALGLGLWLGLRHVRRRTGRPAATLGPFPDRPRE